MKEIKVVVVLDFNVLRAQVVPKKKRNTPEGAWSIRSSQQFAGSICGRGEVLELSVFLKTLTQ